MKYVNVHLFGLSPDKNRAQHQHGFVGVRLISEVLLLKKNFRNLRLNMPVSCLAALLAVEPRGSGYGSFLPHETRHIVNSAKIGSMSRTNYRVADKDLQRQIGNDKVFTLLDILIF